MPFLMFVPRWVYALLAAVVLLVGTYFYGHSKGWHKRDAEMQLAIARKNEEARQIERRLTEELNHHATKLQEANHALDEKATALDRAIRAGRVRLPAPRCVSAPADPAAPSGNSPEAPTESERQTLAAIAAIVADGDRAINQLNACIDAYNQVREQINGQR